MTDRELMQQAVEALDSDNPDIQLRAAIALRERLAQPERKPLSDGWILGMWPDTEFPRDVLKFARAIEAAHGIKEKNA